MTRHLNISPLHRRDHARATTPRGTCTAAEGLDAETFRGFQLAGELFLLTSFFIEPNVYASAERVRGSRRKGTTAPLWAGQPGGGQPRERGPFREYWPFRRPRTGRRHFHASATRRSGDLHLLSPGLVSGSSCGLENAPPSCFEGSRGTSVTTLGRTPVAKSSLAPLKGITSEESGSEK